MKITLFGATGATGRHLIAEALNRGYEVTVFARSTSHFEHSAVQVIRGELIDQNFLTEAIRGSDAVLSALGPVSLKHPKDLPITQALKAITSVMQQEGVKRLVAISTGTAVDPGDRFDFKVRLPALLIKLVLPAAYNDIVAFPQVIRASALEWTMVRIVNLTNRPASKALNVGLYGHSKHSLTISREDVSHFMLNQIIGREFIGQAPGISAQ